MKVPWVLDYSSILDSQPVSTQSWSRGWNRTSPGQMWEARRSWCFGMIDWWSTVVWWGWISLAIWLIYWFHQYALILWCRLMIWWLRHLLLWIQELSSPAPLWYPVHSSPHQILSRPVMVAGSNSKCEPKHSFYRRHMLIPWTGW